MSAIILRGVESAALENLVGGGQPRLYRGYRGSIGER
jgi:hypothetical protein